MVNVLIVEDSRVSREAFERTLSADSEYSVVAAIENAANAEIACMTNRIDLILMDVCTADDESGIRAAGKIKKNYPEVKIIMMTSRRNLSAGNLCAHDKWGVRLAGQIAGRYDRPRKKRRVYGTGTGGDPRARAGQPL